MIKTLFYIIQLGLLIAAAVWLADNPGTVTLDWNEYKISIHSGLVAFVLIATLIAVMIFYRVWRGIIKSPQKWQRYRREKALLHGYDHVTQGLVALAAGDTKNAKYYAKRARQHLPENAEGLTLLLEAQTAKLAGDKQAVEEKYMQLAARKDTALLGVRGLMSTSIEHGDEKSALQLARKALETAPKQTGLLLECYNLETKTGSWDDALKTLKKVEKAGVISKIAAQSDKAAIHTALSDIIAAEEDDTKAIKYLKKALKADPQFLPAIIRLARFYSDNNKRSQVIKLIEKSWPQTPHPELAKLWSLQAPPNKPKDMSIRLRWSKKLAQLNELSVEAYLTIAQTALTEGLWGEARKALEIAEDLRPTTKLYQLWAQLEEKETSDQLKIREWLEKANAAIGEKMWFCTETGRTYSDWTPRANPHKSFNTIVWGVPTIGATYQESDKKLLSV